MNILLISTNRKQKPMPVMPLGACMVAEAAEAAGHRVHFLDLMHCRTPRAALRQALAQQQPEVVGVSIRNIDNNDMQRPEFYPAELAPLLQVIREWRQVPIVLGGAAVSVMPEELLRLTKATCAVTGDGEAAFPALLAKAVNPRDFAEIPGLCWLEEGVFRRNPAQPGPGGGQCAMPDLPRWLEVKAYQAPLGHRPGAEQTGLPLPLYLLHLPQDRGQQLPVDGAAKRGGGGASLGGHGLSPYRIRGQCLQFAL